MHRRPVFPQTVGQDNHSFTVSQLDENEIMLLFGVQRATNSFFTELFPTIRIILGIYLWHTINITSPYVLYCWSLTCLPVYMLTCGLTSPNLLVNAYDCVKVSCFYWWRYFLFGLVYCMQWVYFDKVYFSLHCVWISLFFNSLKVYNISGSQR